MKYIVKTKEMPWKPKFFPGEEKQYGDFKPLWQEHGTEQFEVRLTRIPGRRNKYKVPYPYKRRRMVLRTQRLMPHPY